MHPPSKKFNAGQKILFWSIIVGGLSLVVSGITLLFPFQIAVFEGTFVFLNIFGFGLPENLTMLQEMQLATAWHSIMSMVLIVIVIAHIYIGTVGMEYPLFAILGADMVRGDDLFEIRRAPHGAPPDLKMLTSLCRRGLGPPAVLAARLGLFLGPDRVMLLGPVFVHFTRAHGVKGAFHTNGADIDMGKQRVFPVRPG